MAAAATTSVTDSLGLFLARVPLGLYFFIAGLGKVKDTGVGKFVEGSLSDATKFMPEGMAKIYLTGLPFAEMALGAFLILGLMTRISGTLVTALLVSFIIGKTGIKMGALPFHPNIIFVGLAACIMLLGAGRFSLDAMLWRKNRAVVVTQKTN